MTDKLRGGGYTNRHPQILASNIQAGLNKSIPPENNCNLCGTRKPVQND